MLLPVGRWCGWEGGGGGGRGRSMAIRRTVTCLVALTEIDGGGREGGRREGGRREEVNAWGC